MKAEEMIKCEYDSDANPRCDPWNCPKIAGNLEIRKRIVTGQISGLLRSAKIYKRVLLNSWGYQLSSQKNPLFLSFSFWAENRS